MEQAKNPHVSAPGATRQQLRPVEVRQRHLQVRPDRRRRPSCRLRDELGCNSGRHRDKDSEPHSPAAPRHTYADMFLFTLTARLCLHIAARDLLAGKNGLPGLDLRRREGHSEQLLEPHESASSPETSALGLHAWSRKNTNPETQDPKKRIHARTTEATLRVGLGI